MLLEKKKINITMFTIASDKIFAELKNATSWILLHSYKPKKPNKRFYEALDEGGTSALT